MAGPIRSREKSDCLLFAVLMTTGATALTANWPISLQSSVI